MVPNSERFWWIEGLGVEVQQSGDLERKDIVKFACFASTRRGSSVCSVARASVVLATIAHTFIQV